MSQQLHPPALTEAAADAPDNHNSSLQRPALVGKRLLSTFSTVSRRSFTTASFEADDERSPTRGEYRDDPDSTVDYSDSMPSQEGDVNGDASTPAGDRSLSYSGRDSRPTSPKEIKGWYAYAFAAETYVICGIASFIPILLESLARENGVLLSDPTIPCGSSDSKGVQDGQCVVYILGMQINTASFAMYTFSASVLLQALLVVSISCAADHGSYRKKLLLAFAWIGSCSVMSYIFISKETYILGAILTIISNTSFGASFVLLNSFLPLLVRHHPDVLEVQSFTPHVPDSNMESSQADDSISDLTTQTMINSTSALMADEAAAFPQGVKVGVSHEELTSKELQLSTKISATGIGIGYLAALFVQCVAIGILIYMGNSTWSQRLVLSMIGVWWTLFTIPAAMWLRPRPGPPLVINGRSEGISWYSYFIYSWKSLFRTVQHARGLLDIMLFLAGWFLLSDAIATTSSTAILFAKTQLHMKPWALGMINVISTLSGVLGAFGWSWISRLFSLKPHQTILVCIALFELIPIYGLLGYLPFVQRWGVIGLQQPWEMYPLAAVYGLVLGGLGGYCRSLFGELIPPGSEAAFYALYAITDKGSSVFGPTIVGAIIDRTGSIRPAFWFLGALVGLPAPLIWLINVERGKLEGDKLAKSISRYRQDDASSREAVVDEEERRGMLGDHE